MFFGLNFPPYRAGLDLQISGPPPAPKRAGAEVGAGRDQGSRRGGVEPRHSQEFSNLYCRAFSAKEVERMVGRLFLRVRTF